MNGIGGSSAAKELATLKPWPAPAAAITTEERLARIARARALMTTDAMIIGAGASLRYFAGVGWNATERLVAMILPRQAPPVMICPRFEEGSLVAALSVEARLRLWEEHESPYALTARVLEEMDARALAIDPALSFFMFDGLRAAAPSLAMSNAAPVVDGCRMIKSLAELALMRQAKAMTLEVHRRAALVLREAQPLGSAHFAVGVFQNEMRSNSPVPLVAQPVSVSSSLPLQAAGTDGLEPNQAARSPCSLLLSECSIHRYEQFGCLAVACIMVVSAQPVAPSTGTTLAIGLFSPCSRLTWKPHDDEATTPSFLKSSTCIMASCQ